MKKREMKGRVMTQATFHFLRKNGSIINPMSNKKNYNCEESETRGSFEERLVLCVCLQIPQHNFFLP